MNADLLAAIRDNPRDRRKSVSPSKVPEFPTPIEALGDRKEDESSSLATKMSPQTDRTRAMASVRAAKSRASADRTARARSPAVIRTSEPNSRSQINFESSVKPIIEVSSEPSAIEEVMASIRAAKPQAPAMQTKNMASDIESALKPSDTAPLMASIQSPAVAIDKIETSSKLSGTAALMASIRAAKPSAPAVAIHKNETPSKPSDTAALMASIRAARPQAPAVAIDKKETSSKPSGTAALMASIRAAKPPAPAVTINKKESPSKSSGTADLMASIRAAKPPAPAVTINKKESPSKPSGTADLMASIRAAKPPAPAVTINKKESPSKPSGTADLMASIRAARPPAPAVTVDFQKKGEDGIPELRTVAEAHIKQTTVTKPQGMDALLASIRASRDSSAWINSSNCKSAKECASSQKHATTPETAPTFSSAASPLKEAEKISEVHPCKRPSQQSSLTNEGVGLTIPIRPLNDDHNNIAPSPSSFPQQRRKLAKSMKSVKKLLTANKSAKCDSDVTESKSSLVKIENTGDMSNPCLKQLPHHLEPQSEPVKKSQNTLLELHPPRAKSLFGFSINHKKSKATEFKSRKSACKL